MDMRAQGKGFDAFYQRAQDMGVNFIRSRPSYIKEDPATHDLLITWEDEAGALHTDRYDMVVLSRRPRAGAQGAGGGRRPRRGPQPSRLLRAARVRAARLEPRGRLRGRPVRRAQGHPRLGRPGLGRGGQGDDRPGRLARHAHGRQGVPGRARRRRRRTPRGRVRLPLRLEHRRRDRRRGRRRVRPQAARRGLRQRHHVHVLVRLAHAHQGHGRRARPEPRRGGELHAPHPRADLPGHPARGGPQPVPVRDGQHPRPGELGAPRPARRRRPPRPRT